jgi:hypothetical protein
MITDECIEWDGYTNAGGYGRAWVNGRDHLIHRLAWQEVHGPIPVDPDPKKRLCVLHRCDNPPCFNIDHLFLGTQLDNIRDRDAKGRHVRVPGERQSATVKLTAAQVLEIRVADARGASLRGLGRQYGVGFTTIRRVVERKTWAHLGSHWMFAE